MKKIMFFFLLLMIFILIIVILYYPNDNKFNEQYSKDNDEKFVPSEYVKTKKQLPMYILEGKKYKKIGKIEKDVLLHINKYNDKYYKIEDSTGKYYIKPSNIENYNNKIEENERYKNYIVFNKNIVTKDVTNLYDEKDNLLYTINQSLSLPIIIMKNDKVGIEIFNQLLYIKLDNFSKIVDSNNTKEANVNEIGALNYHFFYDDTNENDKNYCDQDICISMPQFKTQLDYIKENYFTPTMNELEMYIDGNIQLPKSVVITIDDGWRADKAIELLTEYKLNATIFIVTSWYEAKDFKTDYVEVHSHSDNMHNRGDCPNGQGGGIQCLSEERILDDLKKSSNKLDGSKIFCYPFYEYNDYSISMLKKAGYKMAFAGESKNSNNMITKSSNKYTLPRFVIVNYTTMDDFKSYLNGTFYS